MVRVGTKIYPNTAKVEATTLKGTAKAKPKPPKKVTPDA